MSVQDLYFAIFRRVRNAMSGFSDPMTAEAFRRLGQTMSLMDLRLYGSDGLTVDRKGSGMPILKEAISLMVDMRDGVACEDDPNELRQQMLDHMLARRRVPDDQMRRRMSRAVYARTLKDNHLAVFVTEPATTRVGFRSPDKPNRRVAASDGKPCMAEWDFWCGGSVQMPTHVECAFVVPGATGAFTDIDAALVEKARLFSSYKLLTLASEIDDALPQLRLKRLRRLTIGPLRSSVFTEVEDGFAAAVAKVGDERDAWTLSWTADEIESAGTSLNRGSWLNQLFNDPKPTETFVVDTLDINKVERGVTDFDRHVLMPHPVYQALNDTDVGRKLIAERRVHIISDADGLSEDV